MGERFVAVAKALSGRLCQWGLRKLDVSVGDCSERTEFLAAILRERVKGAERVLETMEDFWKEGMRLNGKLSESRNGRSDPRFSERFSNSARTVNLTHLTHAVESQSTEVGSGKEEEYRVHNEIIPGATKVRAYVFRLQTRLVTACDPERQNRLEDVDLLFGVSICIYCNSDDCVPPSFIDIARHRWCAVADEQAWETRTCDRDAPDFETVS